MNAQVLGLVAVLYGIGVQAPQIDYPALWAKATPFDVFLENVRLREEQWRTRFANAAVDAAHPCSRHRSKR